jgi:predicted pyridoxine 5'-phosphate oxidase superfamily flavin-nucleotide-binding protein
MQWALRAKAPKSIAVVDCSSHLLIADLACYGYVAHAAPERGISLAPYPAVRDCPVRFEALPKFKAILKSVVPPEVWVVTDVPFHEDERAAQRIVGVSPSGNGIRSFIPDQHRSFFETLTYAFVATADRWPLPTVLVGDSGFISALTSTELHVAALIADSDPAHANFFAGRRLGLLGLDYSTRRRNRANGRLSSVRKTEFTLDVEESFRELPTIYSEADSRLFAAPESDFACSRFRRYAACCQGHDRELGHILRRDGGS